MELAFFFINEKLKVVVEHEERKKIKIVLAYYVHVLCIVYCVMSLYTSYLHLFRGLLLM